MIHVIPFNEVTWLIFIAFKAMGKNIDIAIDALKVLGYFATGGACFYILSGGKLPFQTKANAQHETITQLQQFERQCNAMTNNDRSKKQSGKDEVNRADSRYDVNFDENTERELR